MATVTGLPDPEDKEKKAAQSSFGAAPTPSGSPAPATASPTKPASSSGFTNIQRYLQAGKGAGQKLAGEIGHTVGQQVEKTQQAVGDIGATKAAVDAERQRLAGAGDIANKIKYDPSSLLNDIGGVTALRTGQTQFGALGQQAQNQAGLAQSQLGQAQQLAQMTGSEAGRFDLLKQSLGRPTYSRGQQKLDQLLLQAEGGGSLGQLQRQSQEQVKQAGQLLGTSKADIEKGLASGGQEATAAQQQIQTALGKMDDPTTPDIDESGGALGSLQQSLKGQVANTRADIQMNVDRAKQAIASGNLDWKTLGELGLAKGDNIYNMNLQELIKPSFNPETITEQSVATPQAIAKYQALAKLAGTNPDYLKEAPTTPIDRSGISPEQKAKFQQQLQGLKTQELGLINQQQLKQKDLATNQQRHDEALSIINRLNSGEKVPGIGGPGERSLADLYTQVNEAKTAMGQYQNEIAGLQQQLTGMGSRRV